MLMRHDGAVREGSTTRAQLTVRGLVQGVGFRPYVFALAKQRALRGRVCNTTAGVQIDVEGDRCAIEQFIDDLRANPPPPARIDAVERADPVALMRYADFRIAESLAVPETPLSIAPDIATCQDCLNELFDPADRRYRYPFINCVHCGLGSIPRSGLKLRAPYAAFDAERKFGVPGLQIADPKACQCGDILKGALKPWECKVFGSACTPETPIGACMVSSEGACAAYYNYGRLLQVAPARG